MKNFYDFKVDNIIGLSLEEKEFRNKELNLFDKNGFPNKREEAWKFTDLNTILSKIFSNITNDYISLKEKKFKLIPQLKKLYFLQILIVSSILNFLKSSFKKPHCRYGSVSFKIIQLARSKLEK